jgi:hypothetical protein
MTGNSLWKLLTALEQWRAAAGIQLAKKDL